RFADGQRVARLCDRGRDPACPPRGPGRSARPRLEITAGLGGGGERVAGVLRGNGRARNGGGATPRLRRLHPRQGAAPAHLLRVGPTEESASDLPVPRRCPRWCRSARGGPRRTVAATGRG